MVIKIIEVIGVSSMSFEDAIQQGVSRAARTVKNITGVDVLGQTAEVKDGRITEFRVTMKLAFVVED